MLGGCSWVNEESDCTDSYNIVRFTYDYNLKYACALDAEVEALTLYLVDSETQKLVKRIDIDHARDLNENNEFVLRTAPGEYDILVWAGRHAKSYDIEPGEVGVSRPEHFHCRMRRISGETGPEPDGRIERLYYGKIHTKLTYASPKSPNRLTVPLMKDTNEVRVVLQQTVGGPVDASDYIVTITDNNGWLNHDNTIRPDETLTYRPHTVRSGSVDINDDPRDARSGEQVRSPQATSASLHEFTVSRLMQKETDPILTVKTKEGKTVLQVSVRDYALMLAGIDRKDMAPQEYLDRQDEYNMTFFLQGGTWLSSVIIINNWRIVSNHTPVE